MKDPTPNDAAFWDERYRAGRIAWDFGRVPRALTDFLRRGGGGGRALVPGCGSAYEVRAFHQAGWDVLALDFSAAAVARARSILGALGERVVVADFFTHAFDPPGFDLIYERTFLCALPPDVWPTYARRMAELLKPGGLLCGFFFFGPEDEPPPYPISPAELDELLGPACTRISDEPVTDSLPLYAGKERWQVWRKKPAPGLHEHVNQ